MARARVLVIGGSGAVGAAICRCLARDGARVALTYHRNDVAARTVADEVQALAVLPCDLRDARAVTGAVEAAIERLGGLDALVVASGDSGRSELFRDHAAVACLMETNVDDLDQAFAVNARGVFLACQAVTPIFSWAQRGQIIVIGSMDGVKAVPSPLHFAISKAALRGLVEALSKALGPEGICVNAVCPGILDAGAVRHLGEDLKRRYLKHCGLERMGTAAEVAELVSWLALNNSYLTGQCLLLDGGL